MKPIKRLKPANLARDKMRYQVYSKPGMSVERQVQLRVRENTWTMGWLTENELRTQVMDMYFTERN